MRFLDNTITRLLIKAALVVVGSAMGGFLFIFFAAIYAGNPIGDAILSAHGFLINKEPANISEKDSAYITYLIEKGHVIPVESYIGQISDYYSDIISTLILVIGLVSGAAFIYIRAVSKLDAEDIAKNTTEIYFESHEFKSRVSEAIKKGLDKEIESGTIYLSMSQMQKISDDFYEGKEKLYERLREELIGYFSENDGSEEGGGDMRLAEDKGDAPPPAPAPSEEQK